MDNSITRSSVYRITPGRRRLVSSNRLPTLALTAGEPAGIGPDLCIQIAQQPIACKLVIIADRELLQIRARQLKLPIQIQDASIYCQDIHKPGSLSVLHTPLSQPALPGKLNSRNAQYVIKTLDIAIAGCQSGQFDAMVTAPVHKGIINDAGITFTGHTEYLAEATQSPVVMMLVGGNMRVTIATTHIPLKDVAAAITPHLIENKLRIIYQDLINRFKISKPRIAVAGSIHMQENQVIWAAKKLISLSR